MADSSHGGGDSDGSAQKLFSVDCCPIALNGEQDFPHGEVDVSLPVAFDDWGGNVCGCGPAVEPCKVLSAGLVPPGAGP